MAVALLKDINLLKIAEQKELEAQQEARELLLLQEITPLLY